MTIAYRYHEIYRDTILIRDFKNIITVNDINDSWNYLLENQKLTNKVKGIINNLDACELNMDFNSFKILTDYLNKNEIFRTLKLAVVCNRPEFIIFPMLGEKEKKLKIKPFTTEQAVVKWINEKK
jgi:hypothetical protein